MDYVVRVRFRYMEFEVLVLVGCFRKFWRVYVVWRLRVSKLDCV